MNLKKRIAELKRLTKVRKRKTGKESIDLLEHRNQLAFNLLNTTISATKEPKLRNEARKNFIVNAVTALDLYFQDTILERKGKWVKEGFDEILTEKLPMFEAIQLFKAKRFSSEHLVVHQSCFQNLRAIDHVFSKLTGTKDFVATIDKFERGMSKQAGIKGGELVSEVIGNLFDTRHKIIHEGYNQTLSSGSVENFHIFVQLFSYTTAIFFMKLDVEEK